MRVLLCAWLLLLGVGGAEQDSEATSAYFAEYGSITDHISMLVDGKRMAAYHDAIMNRAEEDFKGKVVMDVGCGTGVLSVWAAAAGARKVYAVEQSPVLARHARAVAAANGFADVIVVLEGAVEDLQQEIEPLDVLVSEWMGYLLVRESMVSSVLFARDKWLKEAGRMFPSLAALYLAPLDDPLFVEEKLEELEEHMFSFEDVIGVIKNDFSGLDLAALREPYLVEHATDIFRVGWQGRVPLDVVDLTQTRQILKVDMRTATHAQFLDWSLNVTGFTGKTSALVAWFDVGFPGGVVLSTSPAMQSGTHWGQTAMLLTPAMSGPFSITLRQSETSKHDIDFQLTYHAHLDEEQQPAKAALASSEGRLKDASVVQATYAITAHVRGYAQDWYPLDEEEQEEGYYAEQEDDDDRGEL